MPPRRSPEVEAELAARLSDPRRPEVDAALQPFVNLSALAGTLLMTVVGLLVLVPLWWAERQGWTGAGVGRPLLYVAPLLLVLLFVASRAGVRRQLGPLAMVAARLAERLEAGPVRVRGRLRKGWGAAVELPLPGGEAVRVVAARGQRARPELYLVHGEREFRFEDPKDPVPELEGAVRAVGLAAGPAESDDRPA